MGNGMTVTTRTFTVKEGMTPEDVIKSPNATAQQKKMAFVFDADGVKGYSKREAVVFNATTIADHDKGGVSLWTKYADGSRKETLVKGDLKAFKYAPQGEIKPIAYKEENLITRKTKSAKKETTFITDKNSKLKYPANYQRVEVGKGGIVSSETLNYTGTDKPERIIYRLKDKSLAFIEEFDKNGKLEAYVEYNGKPINGYKAYDRYNANGEKTGYGYFIEGNAFHYAFIKKDGTLSHYEDYDIKSDRLVERYCNERTYKYNPDGSYTTEKWGDGGMAIEKYNTKDQLISKKQMDYNDVLKYTVIPKRDKDGDVIKNDTIWNK